MCPGCGISLHREMRRFWAWMLLWIGLTPLTPLLGATLPLSLGIVVGMGVVLYVALVCRWYLVVESESE